MTKIKVENTYNSVVNVQNEDYISLTDMAHSQMRILEDTGGRNLLNKVDYGATEIYTNTTSDRHSSQNRRVCYPW